MPTPKRRKPGPPSRTMQKKLLKRVDKVIGRPVMIEALQTIGEPKAELLWQMMMDPAFAHEGLASLAKKCDLTFGEVHDLFRRSKILEGTFKVYEDFPNLMDDVRTDARTTLKTCPVCNGNAKVKDVDTGRSRKCTECDGKGRVRVIGDKDSRKHILEMAGLIGKTSPLVAIQNNVGGNETLEDTIGSAHSLVRVERPQITEGETK